ncbi:MAG: WbqC family protein [Prevotellaceae bacterium]|jgi:hypothetical protein|nr:WbqC family protein [Prevotellaceae bacterium]
MALFSTAYWAPISYYLLSAQSNWVRIERHESYQKQSYRNRCTILSANGPLSLVVPILRPHDCSIKEARIDYSIPWQHTHWRAIEAAYRSSAYFEEYSQQIQEVYCNEIPFLFDLNIKIWELSLNLLDITVQWSLSDHFAPLLCETNDFRDRIHPKAKHLPEGIGFEPYFQVFGHKYGFIPNLSILDLIFNEGRFPL